MVISGIISSYSAEQTLASMGSLSDNEFEECMASVATELTECSLVMYETLHQLDKDTRMGEGGISSMITGTGNVLQTVLSLILKGVKAISGFVKNNMKKLNDKKYSKAHAGIKQTLNSMKKFNVEKILNMKESEVKVVDFAVLIDYTANLVERGDDKTEAIINKLGDIKPETPDDGYIKKIHGALKALKEDAKPEDILKKLSSFGIGKMYQAVTETDMKVEDIKKANEEDGTEDLKEAQNDEYDDIIEKTFETPDTKTMSGKDLYNYYYLLLETIYESELLLANKSTSWLQKMVTKINKIELSLQTYISKLTKAFKTSMKDDTHEESLFGGRDNSKVKRRGNSGGNEDSLGGDGDDSSEDGDKKKKKSNYADDNEDNEEYQQAVTLFRNGVVELQKLMTGTFKVINVRVMYTVKLVDKINQLVAKSSNSMSLKFIGK